MSRPFRKADEQWAINLLLDFLHSENSEWLERPNAPTDKPDVVLSSPDGLCVACEITQVGLSEWHQWCNDSRLQLEADQLDEIPVPREVDLWLERAVRRKTSDAPGYAFNAASV